MGAAGVQDDGRIDDTSAESDEADSRSRSLHSDSESEAASGGESGSGEQRLSIRTGAAARRPQRAPLRARPHCRAAAEVAARQQLCSVHVLRVSLVCCLPPQLSRRAAEKRPHA
jgi:hypothetical protein